MFGFRLDFDDAGRRMQVVNLDQKGEPMKNRVGIIALGCVYNERGQLTRLEYRDGAGRAAPWNGVAFFSLDYDAVGNIVSLRRWSSENKIVQRAEWLGDVEPGGTLRGKRSSGLSSGLHRRRLTPLARTVFEYDAFGYPIDSKDSAARTRASSGCGTAREMFWRTLVGSEGKRSRVRMLVDRALFLRSHDFASGGGAKKWSLDTKGEKNRAQGRTPPSLHH